MFRLISIQSPYWYIGSSRTYKYFFSLNYEISPKKKSARWINLIQATAHFAPPPLPPSPPNASDDYYIHTVWLCPHSPRSWKVITDKLSVTWRASLQSGVGTRTHTQGFMFIWSTGGCYRHEKSTGAWIRCRWGGSRAVSFHRVNGDWEGDLVLKKWGEKTEGILGLSKREGNRVLVLRVEEMEQMEWVQRSGSVLMKWWCEFYRPIKKNW